MQWTKFLSRFGLWLLGIPINIVPVAFKQLNSITVETFPGVKTIAIMAIGDFDFSFISVSVLFILCIEAFLQMMISHLYIVSFNVVALFILGF